MYNKNYKNVTERTELMNEYKGVKNYETWRVIDQAIDDADWFELGGNENLLSLQEQVSGYFHEMLNDEDMEPIVRDFAKNALDEVDWEQVAQALIDYAIEQKIVESLDEE